jgi:hypothetical protein
MAKTEVWASFTSHIYIMILHASHFPSVDLPRLAILRLYDLPCMRFISYYYADYLRRLDQTTIYCIDITLLYFYGHWLE